MSRKFNFLDSRTASAKAAADLRRNFPNRPASWINRMATAMATAAKDISRELYDPQPFATIKKKSRRHG